MPKYSLPKYPLPQNSPLPAVQRPGEPALVEGQPAEPPPGFQPYPARDFAAGTVPGPLARPPEPSAPALRRAAKGVYSMLKRLRSSFLRSGAVHDARMDAALNGNQGYLLLHYFQSVK